MNLLRSIFVSAIAGTFLSLFAVALQSNSSAIVTLSKLRGSARPLLIFAPDGSDSRLKEQLDILKANSKEAIERDLVAVVVAESGSDLLDRLDRRLSEADSVEARRKFHISYGEFAVVLIGKDGGEKLRSGKPISFQILRETIDAMPMRKDEMRSH